MRRLFSFVVVAIALVSAMPERASAAQTTQTCQGGYLAGFRAMRGVWVDRLGAVCRKWNGTSLGPDQPMPLLATSTGGSAEEPAAVCPPGFAVSDITYWLPSVNGQWVAQHLDIMCKNVDWPHNGSPKHLIIHTTGSGINVCSGIVDNLRCPFNASPKETVEACDVTEAATGWTGDVEQYVGHIELHCGALPPAKPIGRPNINVENSVHHLGTDVTGGDNSSGDNHSHRMPHHHVDHGTLPVFDNLAGEWNTSQGHMTLTQSGDKVRGTYGNDNGRIAVQLHGDHWLGYWSETHSNQHCGGLARLGSEFWGRVEFWADNNNRDFKGRWSYCDDSPAQGQEWTGAHSR